MNPAYNLSVEDIAKHLEEHGNDALAAKFSAFCRHVDQLTEASKEILEDYRGAVKWLREDGDTLEGTEGLEQLADKLEDCIDSTPAGTFARLLRYRHTWPDLDEFSLDHAWDEAEEWERRLNWTLIQEGSERWAVLVTTAGERLTKTQFEEWKSRKQQ